MLLHGLVRHRLISSDRMFLGFHCEVVLVPVGKKECALPSRGEIGRCLAAKIPHIPDDFAYSTGGARRDIRAVIIVRLGNRTLGEP